MMKIIWNNYGIMIYIIIISSKKIINKIKQRCNIYIKIKNI